MNIGFKHNYMNGIEYLSVPQFEKYDNLKCVFSTRNGGVSEGECSSLNFGFKRKDTRDNILKNYEIFCDACGIDIEKLVLTNQEHSTIIKAVDTNDYGTGIFKDKFILGVDGLITDVKGPVLVTFFADCVPVFLFDSKNGVIANLHSGWRGTLNGITSKAIGLMEKYYGSNPENIIAAIGPSICKCHFEVDNDVYEQFKEKYGEFIDEVTEQRAEKYYIDLWQIIIHQLKNAGVLDDNITLANECTYCNNDKYFSFRGDKGHTGNLAGFMCLK